MAVGDVKARFVRSDGREMTLGDGTWRIPKDGLENWANLPYDVSKVEIPSYDGALVTSKRVNSVDRSVRAVVASPSDNERQRRLAISFFNPKHTFKCYLTYMGRTRWCEGELYGFKASEGNIGESVQVDVTLLCPNPYLQSVEDFGKDIAETVPAFGFPFISPLPVSDGSVNGMVSGFIVGRRVFQRVVEISNDGDVPSGMVVTIRCDGDIVNPMVKIGDGVVALKTRLIKDDVVVLNASSRPPTIKLNGKNAMHLLDRKSNILDMVIGVGDTTIEYSADSGEQFMHVVVRYNKQYLGV